MHAAGNSLSQPAKGGSGANSATLTNEAASSPKPSGNIRAAPKRREIRASGSCNVIINNEARIKSGPSAASLLPERRSSTGNAR